MKLARKAISSHTDCASASTFGSRTADPSRSSSDQTRSRSPSRYRSTQPSSLINNDYPLTGMRPDAHKLATQKCQQRSPSFSTRRPQFLVVSNCLKWFRIRHFRLTLPRIA